jgi:hypothetical protein
LIAGPLSLRKSAIVLKSGVSLRSFQPPARTHPVQVAVEVEPQQIAGIIGRPARLRQRGVAEAEFLQREFLDKGVDETHRVLGRDVVVEDFGKEQALLARGSSNVVHAGN